MNEDFDLERKEDIAILSESLAEEMGYLIREVEILLTEFKETKNTIM